MGGAVSTRILRVIVDAPDDMASDDLAAILFAAFTCDDSIDFIKDNGIKFRDVTS